MSVSLVMRMLRKRWPAAALWSVLLLLVAGVALLPVLVMKRIVVSQDPLFFGGTTPTSAAIGRRRFRAWRDTRS